MGWYLRVSICFVTPSAMEGWSFVVMLQRLGLDKTQAKWMKLVLGWLVRCCIFAPCRPRRSSLSDQTLSEVNTNLKTLFILKTVRKSDVHTQSKHEYSNEIPLTRRLTLPNQATGKRIIPEAEPTDPSPTVPPP